jgi:hypothetical protein
MHLYQANRKTCIAGHTINGINGKTVGVKGLKTCRKCERSKTTKEVTMKAANPKFSHAEKTTKEIVVVSDDEKAKARAQEAAELAEKQAAYMLDENGNQKAYAIKTWGPDKGEPDPYYSGTKYLIPDGATAAEVKKAKKRKDYEQRECHRSFIHNPHRYYSYYLKFETECRGSGKPPATTYTYTKKAMTRYDTEEWGVIDKNGNLKPMSIERAKKIALDMHKDQKDKLGYAYGGHLLAVYEGVKVLGGGKDEQIAALFHDAEEDDHTTFKHLEEIGLNENTIDIIKAVSKHSGEEQNHYLSRIIAQGPEAMRVKLADLIHNTRHDRIAELRTKTGGEATANRLLKKYRPAMAALMLELNMLADEERQNLVTKPVGSATGTTYYGTSAPKNTGGKSTPTTHKSTSSNAGKTFTKPMEMTPRTLQKGDWLGEEHIAPIMGPVKGGSNSDGTVEWALLNGEIVTLDKNRKYKVWTYTQWSTDINVTFPGVSEDDYSTYIGLIDGAK